MPELPEVEVLVRHLGPLLTGKKIRNISVLRPKVTRPTSAADLSKALSGARFSGVTRRGKYLVFHLKLCGTGTRLILLGHLGMTGRMYVQPRQTALPKHTSVVINLGTQNLVFEDTRFFGRLTLDTTPLEKLGPEPLEPEFSTEDFYLDLKSSTQAVKVKLLDQKLVAGLGNIYASEALYLAGISPRLPARRLRREQVRLLHGAIRKVLSHAIACGSTVPLNYSGNGKHDGLFYFGTAAGAGDYYTERLRVYDRLNQPCARCRHPIRRIVQAGRSTYFCPNCQEGH